LSDISEHKQAEYTAKQFSAIVESSDAPIKGADGRIIGASKIARDITERREALDRHSSCSSGK